MSDGQEGTGVQVLLPANCVRMPVVWFENGFDDHARVCWFCFPSASRFFFFLLLLLLLLLVFGLASLFGFLAEGCGSRLQLRVKALPKYNQPPHSVAHFINLLSTITYTHSIRKPLPRAKRHPNSNKDNSNNNSSSSSSRSSNNKGLRPHHPSNAVKGGVLQLFINPAGQQPQNRATNRVISKALLKFLMRFALFVFLLVLCEPARHKSLCEVTSLACLSDVNTDTHRHTQISRTCSLSLSLSLSLQNRRCRTLQTDGAPST